MINSSKPKLYRDIIDSLVKMCHEGQGQISARRVRDGIWDPNATPESLAAEEDDGILPPEVVAEIHRMKAKELEINLFLKRLTLEDREILADLLSQQVVTGVFETLKTLEEFNVPPFEDGYESSPFNDFIGRLDDWEWPES
jgi:hypothetical protein